jgi:FMN phosphatase YigB (HAD superfamily)
MKPMKLVVFDVDGVLNDAQEVLTVRYRAQIEYIAKKRRISFLSAEKEYQRVRMILPEDQGFAAIDVYKALGYSRRVFFSVINNVDSASIARASPNVHSILAGMKKKYKLAVYSNTPKLETGRVLRKLKLNYFQKVYTADQFTESKPSLNNLKKILRDFKCAPIDALVVGDSYAKDISPARQLGMHGILVSKHKHEHVATIKDLRGLPRALRQEGF